MEIRHLRIPTLVLIAALYACGASPPGGDAESGAAGQDPEAAAPAGSADVGPSDEDPGRAAAAVLRDYFEALDQRRYADAWAMWGDGGVPDQTLVSFTAQRRLVSRLDFRLGAPGRVEGAAGSRFVEIPVQVRETLADGGHRMLLGSVVMRRVVVDGASDAERRWHLYRVDLSRPAGLPGDSAIIAARTGPQSSRSATDGATLEARRAGR